VRQRAACARLVLTSCHAQSATAFRLRHGSGPYCCDVLGCAQRTKRTYKTRKSLMGHQRLHLDALSFMCEQCGQTVLTRWQLNDHVAKHAAQALWKCACGRKYTHHRTGVAHIEKEQKKCGGETTTYHKLERMAE
jgi:hypothetical protein